MPSHAQELGAARTFHSSLRMPDAVRFSSYRRQQTSPRDAAVARLKIIVLLALWLLGFLVIPIAGGLIHVLLVVALVVLIHQLVTGRRSL